MTVEIEAPDGDVLELVSPSQRFSPQVEVTERPVEGGGNVSDHAQLEPLDFRVRGVVSEHPFDFPNNNVGAKTPAEAVEFFEKIAEQRVDVTTDRLGTFAGCVLQSWPHEITIEQSIGFDMSFRQVRVATFESVEIPPEAPAPAQQSGAPDEQLAGRQPKEPRSPQKAAGDGGAASTGQEDVPAAEQSDEKSASVLYKWTIGG